MSNSTAPNLGSDLIKQFYFEYRLTVQVKKATSRQVGSNAQFAYVRGGLVVVLVLLLETMAGELHVKQLKDNGRPQRHS